MVNGRVVGEEAKKLCTGIIINRETSERCLSNKTEVNFCCSSSVSNDRVVVVLEKRMVLLGRIRTYYEDLNVI